MNVSKSCYVANNTFTDTLVAKNAFVLDLVARNTFTDALAAKTAFIDELVANTAFINEIFSKNVSITGELTMGSSGEISNSARSYKILDTGFGVYTASNISTKSSYTVYSANTVISGDVAVLRIGAAVNAITGHGDAIIEANVSAVGLIIRSNGSAADMTLRSKRHLTISTQFGTGELRLRVNSNEGMNISGLPTTNPGGTNNVYRKAAGNVGSSEHVLCIT